MDQPKTYPESARGTESSLAYYVAVGCLGLFMLLHFLLLAFLVAGVWPPPEITVNTIHLPIVGSFSLSYEIRIVVFVMIMGAFGGSLVGVDVFSELSRDRKWVVGPNSDTEADRSFDLSRPFFAFFAYNLHAFVGAGIALLIYTVIRAGLTTVLVGAERSGAGDVPPTLDPMGIAAIAGLSGAFSYQAAAKLREVAETIFATREPEKVVRRPPKEREDRDDAR